MTTDTTERGLERLICTALAGHPCEPAGNDQSRDFSPDYDTAGWIGGDPADFNREYCVDMRQLVAFLQETQGKTAEALEIEQEGPTRRKFLARLEGQISKRGVIDVLRGGVKHGPHSIDLFYGKPSPGNPRAQELYDANIFSLSRQLRYSQDETELALDLCLFINGLPVVTFELKNNLTKQTVRDAIDQYKRDRSPRERLFQFGRCAVHFAVDDQMVYMCTHLQGKDSWFLPFNKGWKDGAGNPPNPDGLKTDYLWKEVLTRESLTDIIENFAQIVEEKDDQGRKVRKQIFPRYHQLDVVRKLLGDAADTGAGERYLVQHSAGSGKSNSIAWLAHQLVGMEKDGEEIFDSIIVVTDRRVLDKQIRETIKQYAQVSAVIGAVTSGSSASKSRQLAGYLRSGKKIIIGTVQTFPYILEQIGSGHRDKNFAIVIDEAHSSQGGKLTSALNKAISGDVSELGPNPDYEDLVNAIMEDRKMPSNASYFAFTATPKNKTLEIFGTPVPIAGQTKHRPFHTYTMKQAIEEGFILDVLQNYTPVESYYRLAKTVPDDPDYDAKKATKKLRRYVESHDHAIRNKAEIMVEHFHNRVAARRKIGGQARAMLITSGIQRAIQYYYAFGRCLRERKSPYEAIAAFSGEPEYRGETVTEASLNGFSSSRIKERFREDPYRFLIVADKFQTGYDEPLLHTMYVDKPLSGVRAVQTLSRLNRAHPQKRETFVLDFVNDVDTIQTAFADYYRTTILSEETDPNKLHDLKDDLDNCQVYSPSQVDELVRLYLEEADRDELDPILDGCVATYLSRLDEDKQVDFKGKAKAFVRTYEFLSAILPYTNAGWEKLSIFLNFLIPKLPAPEEDDLSKGVLESVDMASYRAEMQASMDIALPDEEGEVEPVPMAGGGYQNEPELDPLSVIIKKFNDQFGNIEWKDEDRIREVITEELPQKVKNDTAYQNAMKHSDKDAARLEHDRALEKVLLEFLSDHTELYGQYSDNESFRQWLSETNFQLTYEPEKE